MRLMPALKGPDLGIELIYSAIIVLACLFIYFRTKELHDLTSHKGIKYFRNTFLFFGIAYLVRVFIRLFATNFNLRHTLTFHPKILFAAVLFVFIYATSMAVFYLVLSISYKKLPKRILENPIILHLPALAIALLTVFLGTPLLFLTVQTALLLYSVIESYSAKKRSTFHIIYLLLFAFSILYILQVAIPRFFVTIQVILYILSAVLFLVIAKLVNKHASSKK